VEEESTMSEVLGNTKGLKEVVLKQLEALQALQVPVSQLVSEELAVKMMQLSQQINREISIYVSRGGQVINVAIGNSGTVELPQMEGRRGAGRLSGIRCLHTHPGGTSELSGIDISALKNNKYDLMAALSCKGPDFAQTQLSFAMIVGFANDEQPVCEEYGPLSLAETEGIFLPNLIATVEKNLEKQSGDGNVTTAETKEKAMLIALEYGNNSGLWSCEDSIEELKQLADTAGAVVVGSFIQKRPKPDPAFFIGKGKVQELALYGQQEDVDLCIFDDELSPAQQRNIEQALGIRVLDRTALILDIFAQRARTNEGKLQVELAQLQYQLPRIMGQGLVLSRLGGGIGTRGPGETKLEVDRRRIRERIAYIKECIDGVQSVRSLHQAKRVKNQVQTICLVGYTNAGKSTLLNTLTNSDIYAKDQLFATLDPTTRQLELPDKRIATLTDTVGFIQRLPHQLVAAFKSTLEVVCEADLLLHVVDVSHPLYKEQSEAVYKVLQEIGASDKEILTVYNKIDKLPADTGLPTRLSQEDNAVCLSAKSGTGIPKLLDAIVEHLKLKTTEAEFLVPYSASGKVTAALHTSGTVLQEEYREQGVYLKVRLDLKEASKFESYLINKGE